MPRPKPPEPLIPRCIRLSQTDWETFQDRGGLRWLRKILGGRPVRYWEVFQKERKK